ncbi:MAG: hypothetical protein WAP07_01245 [Acutalibacteraceae bacterium]
MRKIGVILFLFFFLGCVKTKTEYVPVPAKISGEAMEYIERTLENIKTLEEQLLKIERQGEFLMTETESSFLIEKEYFRTFLKKDEELAKLSLMFEAVLNDFLEEFQGGLKKRTKQT